MGHARDERRGSYGCRRVMSGEGVVGCSKREASYGRGDAKGEGEERG